MIISRTPFRISFFGGGSDYPQWYREHGGQVLATAIDKYCYITCRYLPPFFEHRYRVVYSKIEDCLNVDEIEHPVVREILKFLDFNRGIEIHHDGDLPARSGMGSSSSFTVGLLHALNGLKGQLSSQQQLAIESIHVDQDLLGETVGSQDQVLAAYGGLRHVVFSKDGEISANPVTLSPERTSQLNDGLMLFYTGIKRTASDVASTYVEDISSQETRIQEMMGMVTEGISILNSNDDLDRFGLLLDHAWKAKSSLSSSISNSDIDEIYASAKDAGAIGGKLLGAGGGGFMILYARPSDQEKIKEHLNKLIHVPFKLEPTGSQIIFYDQEEDYSQVEEARAKQTVQAFRELA